MSESANLSMQLRRTAGVPFAIYKQRQAAFACSHLYTLTAFYVSYAIAILITAFSTTHPWTAVVFLAAGWVIWTSVEHLFHRYVPNNKN